MEENLFDNCVFGEYFFFFPDRLAWMHVKDMFSDKDDCIICDKNDHFLSRKEDMSFA